MTTSRGSGSLWWVSVIYQWLLAFTQNDCTVVPFNGHGPDDSHLLLLSAAF